MPSFKSEAIFESWNVGYPEAEDTKERRVKHNDNLQQGFKQGLNRL
jgi:hypothetical protein